MDHDQRFKVLLMEFFRELMLLFWPEWAERFDFRSLEWLLQEVFLDPPKGERRSIDLVVKLPVKDPKAKGKKRYWMALVHIEIESRKSAEALRKRVYEYYHELREKHQLPVLPLAILLNVGLDGLGVEVYEEHFGTFRLLHFQYLYAGLPGLDGLQYLAGDNPLGVALAPLMRLPKAQRVELTAQALARLVETKESMYRKFLLCECVQAYAPLTSKERQDLDSLLVSEPYSGVQAMAKTWYEQGEEKGEERGQRKILRRLLERRFGPLKGAALKKFESWPAEKLPELSDAILTAKSLKELGLGK